MKRLLLLLRGILVTSTATMCALTFVWPFTVSHDPSHPGFKLAAVAAFVAFLVSLAFLLACKGRRT